MTALVCLGAVLGTIWYLVRRAIRQQNRMKP